MVLTVAVAACSLDEKQQSSYYVIDPRFDEIYQKLQGESVLGPPISNKKYVAGTNQEKQYFESGVLVFDPDASPSYYLYPVGQDAGFSDIPNQDPENPSVRYQNGFIIPLEFARVYEQLGGERWVGPPLTRARFNPEKNTIEQYFQNLGFFRYEDDPPGDVHFMPYGLWKCAGECAMYPGVQNAALSSSAAATLASPFSEVISRLGTSFTGEAITQPYQAADGNLEQIFENVVLYQDPTSPLGAGLRPIVPDLGLSAAEHQKHNAKSEEYFREVEGGKGYFIPSYFLDFLNRYSGFELSGEPVSRSQQIREGVFRQCFESYCLLFDSQAPAGAQVRLAALGRKYQEITRTPAAANSPDVDQDRQRFQLDIWEQSPQISSSETQQIGACIHNGDQALSGVTAVLTLQMEGTSQQTHQFNPTDSGGCSFLELEPIQARNGSTVDYQVCFLGISDQQLCKHDSFLIWGNREEPTPSEPAADHSAGEASGKSDHRQVETQLVLDLWEVSSQISSSERQEVGACIHQGNQPLVGMKSELKLVTPHNGVIFYRTSPTDQGGCSFFRMDPVEAKNGETVPYEVCFFQKNGKKICQRDSFLIWGNP